MEEVMEMGVVSKGWWYGEGCDGVMSAKSSQVVFKEEGAVARTF
jgi:hypothetical protein